MLQKLFWPFTVWINCSCDLKIFANSCPSVSNFNGILLPKLFWPTVRKNCSSDREKPLKFEVEGQFAKILRSQEQFIQKVKGQYNFWNRMLF